MLSVKARLTYINLRKGTKGDLALQHAISYTQKQQRKGAKSDAVAFIEHELVAAAWQTV